MAAFTPVAPAVRGSLDGFPNDATLVASGTYTATGTAEFGVPGDAKVVEVVYNQTAGTAAQSVVVSIEAFNQASGAWEELIASAARTQATTDSCSVQVNPFTPAVTNVSAQRVVRKRMRAKVAHADTKNVTYSLLVAVQ